MVRYPVIHAVWKVNLFEYSEALVRWADATTIPRTAEAWPGFQLNGRRGGPRSRLARALTCPYNL
jgi:hypothetical protein